MQIIDTDTYPIHDRAAPAFRALLDQVQGALDRDGCAVLKGFVRPTAIPELVKEAETAAPRAHRSTGRTNAYFTKDDPTLPPDHPMRRFYDRSNAFIPGDNFGGESLLRQIYTWPPFAAFAKSALRQDRFFPYADPLGDVIVNAADEGNGFPWHFDTNNFTLTLCLQNADDGGAFEYAPNIRREGENFAAVSAVLNGSSPLIKTLHLEPGDLQIFKGRYSLHRVAPLKGKTPRYVAIFSFVEDPDMVGAPERTKQLYGKVLPIHLERAGQRSDQYID